MTPSPHQTTDYYQALVPLRIELRSSVRSSDVLLTKHEDCRLLISAAMSKQIVDDAHKAQWSYEEIMLDYFRGAFTLKVQEEGYGGEEFRRIIQAHQRRVWVCVTLDGEITYTRIAPPPFLQKLSC